MMRDPYHPMRRRPASTGPWSDGQGRRQPEAAAPDERAEEIARLRAEVEELRGRLAEVEELRRRLADAEAQSEERLGQVQRLRADHVNYRRRLEQERDDERRLASSMLIIKLLPVLDDFERAMDTVGPQLAGLNWVQGVGQIARKLKGTLESQGLVRIDPQGQPFDPAQHEAVLREETDDDEAVGRVLAVMQPGYRLGDRLIRPAMVKVGVSRQ